MPQTCCHSPRVLACSFGHVLKKCRHLEPCQYRRPVVAVPPRPAFVALPCVIVIHLPIRLVSHLKDGRNERRRQRHSTWAAPSFQSYHRSFPFLHIGALFPVVVGVRVGRTFSRRAKEKSVIPGKKSFVLIMMGKQKNFLTVVFRSSFIFFGAQILIVSS